MRKSKGRLLRRPPDANFWFCQCHSCRSIFRLPRSGVKPLKADIGKAKCTFCGGLLRRTQRRDGETVHTITRAEARLKDVDFPDAAVVSTIRQA